MRAMSDPSSPVYSSCDLPHADAVHAEARAAKNPATESGNACRQEVEPPSSQDDNGKVLV
ncbi:MAG: hypothetical protein OTJ43_09200 [Dehalococcoidia bacterium]|nr:hypothetical protein [Dehalococcoidia bacterium]